ncbi:hypothetical protein HNP24_000295 [Chryseobacterium sediminis]|uniref:Transposase n=1 Tax=Chryseobacterium sediminis TaxID=1679494 RepID=A0ABR6PUH3_9FLAO|nr:hypothetical protein [Chryseobacterium sediminis]MBB6329345.1 hypothetical protein [Chryseobacterium sediminis]
MKTFPYPNYCKKAVSIETAFFSYSKSLHLILDSYGIAMGVQKTQQYAEFLFISWLENAKALFLR